MERYKASQKSLSMAVKNLREEREMLVAWKHKNGGSEEHNNEEREFKDMEEVIEMIIKTLERRTVANYGQRTQHTTL